MFSQAPLLQEYQVGPTAFCCFLAVWSCGTFQDGETYLCGLGIVFDLTFSD